MQLLKIKFKLEVLMILIFILFMYNASASEDILLTKYGYGSLIWNYAKHDSPAIWSYPIDSGKVYSSYELGDSQNKINQDKHKIKVHLTVQQKDSNLLATVIFYNGSTQPFYIHRSRFPTDSFFYPLCGSAFSIKTDGIQLDYLGKQCQLGTYKNKVNWLKIPAGKKYNFTVKLNDAYEFLSGKRRYNIGTLEYFVVNDKWFIEQSIYDSLLSILKFKYTCKGREDIDYINRVRWSCEFNQSNIEDLFSKLGYDGLNDEIYFEVRTNQIVTLINGDRLHSFYKKN